MREPYLFSSYVKNKLKENWGEKADTFNCYAEVKLIDPLSSWACYIFAMDESERLIQCLLYTKFLGVETYTQCIDDIYSMYNAEGEYPIIDTEYRRTKVIQLLERLNVKSGEL